MASRPEQLLIPIAWSDWQKLMRGALLCFAGLPVIFLVTLPLLSLDVVLWMCGLLFAILVLVFTASKIVPRQEIVSINKRGPFIELSADELVLPNALSAKRKLQQRTGLSGLGFSAWRSANLYRPLTGSGVRGNARVETAYLALFGNGLDIILSAGDGSVSIKTLPRIGFEASIARRKAAPILKVDAAALLRAEAHLAKYCNRSIAAENG